MPKYGIDRGRWGGITESAWENLYFRSMRISGSFRCFSRRPSVSRKTDTPHIVGSLLAKSAAADSNRHGLTASGRAGVRHYQHVESH